MLEIWFCETLPQLIPLRALALLPGICLIFPCLPLSPSVMTHDPIGCMPRCMVAAEVGWEGVARPGPHDVPPVLQDIDKIEHCPWAPNHSCCSPWARPLPVTKSVTTVQMAPDLTIMLVATSWSVILLMVQSQDYTGLTLWPENRSFSPHVSEDGRDVFSMTSSRTSLGSQPRVLGSTCHSCSPEVFDSTSDIFCSCSAW